MTKKWDNIDKIDFIAKGAYSRAFFCSRNEADNLFHGSSVVIDTFLGSSG